MNLIEKYLGEGTDLKFNKTNFHKIMNSGKGVVVYATGGGYSDTKEFGLTGDQIKKAIEKGKLDIIFKNADMAVKGAKDPKMKGRKFMVRVD